MKKSPISLREMTALCVITLATTIPGADYTWSGASGANLFWATPGNWSPSGPPGPNDDVRFFDPGATNDLGLVNSIVAASTTIHSFWGGQTNGVHNLFINPGVTLTVTGTNDNGYGPLGSDPAATAPDPLVQSTFYVGSKSEVSLTNTVTNTVAGEGTLILNNPNNELNVRQAWGGGGGAHRAVLDLSGLGTFTANLGRIRIGDGEAGTLRRSDGQLWLAKTNTITLTGTNYQENVQLIIGNNDVNNNGNGSISYLYLGQQTTLNVDEILVGARKQQGNISFNPNFTSPSLVLRGSDGIGRTRAFRIGDESDQNASGNPTTGTVNLSAGTVDILADSIFVGKHQTGGGQSATGMLTLGAGTLNVNTLQLADQTDNQPVTTPPATATTGTVNLNGTAVQVNHTLWLGRYRGGTGPMNANLNMNGGTLNVAGAYTNQGTVNINLTNSQLNLPAGSRIAANNVNLDGSTISNVAVLTVTNQLTIVNSGDIVGNPAFNLGNSGLASWNVEGVAGGSLSVSNAFLGSGTCFGNLVLAPGALLSPGGNGTVGLLSITPVLSGGNATLNNSLLRFDLSNSGFGGNDQITVTGTLTLNGTNDVNLNAVGGTLDTVNPYTLITAGTLVGDQSRLRIAGPLAQSRHTFAFDTTSTPNTVKLTVGGTGSQNLTWVGDGSANTWDTKGAANWTLGAPSQFFSLDAVTFNDTGSASPSVNLVGSLIPSSVAVNNAAKNYTFGGIGGLAVSGALTKSSAGTLTFNHTGDNSFSGAVIVNAGNVTFANTGHNTYGAGLTVNGGSVTLSGDSMSEFAPATSITIGPGASLTVANANANAFNDTTVQLDGTLTFNQTTDAVLGSVISGAGTVTKAGTNLLVVSGLNSGLTSVVQVNAGTVRAGSATALGAGATVADGARLDLYGQNLGTTPITATGAGPNGGGAIVSTAGAQGAGAATVTLTGNTTFGGAGAWNTDPVLNVGLWTISASLSTGGQGYNLTKVGPNQVTLNNAMVDAALGDIDVQQGLLQFAGTTDTMGNATRTLTVRAGATVSFSSTSTPWDKRVALFGNGTTPSLLNYNGDNTIVGPVTLNGDCIVGAVPPDRGAPVSMTLAGGISGSGSLIKASQDTLILSGTNTHTGSTLVSNGTLVLSGSGSIPTSTNIVIAAGAALDSSLRTDGTLTLANGQTLGGDGTISGILIAALGSTVSPGASIGSLSITGHVTLRGTVAMELDAAAGTNDVISSQTGIALDGAVISVSNVAGTLLDGATFRLFDAPAGQISGTFTLQPATPGPGQTWNTSSLAMDGTLKVVGNPVVVTQPQITSVRLWAGNLEVSGSGGTPGGSYTVLTNGDVALAVTNWAALLSQQFDASGNFSFTNAHSPNTPQLFYRLQAP